MRAVAVLVMFMVLSGCQGPAEEDQLSETEAVYRDLIQGQGRDLSEIYAMDTGDILPHDRIMSLAIRFAWDESSVSNQQSLCWSYDEDPDATLEFLTEEGGHGYLSVAEQKEVFTNFFEARC